MPKNKRLYQLLETKKALEELLHEAVKQVDFYKNRVAEYTVKLSDLNEIIEEMRGGK
ncbi:hypothetical protein [uncultured Treponema sp.]|uniref:hypothetical protein n=1 Tax=uncultured Treponema sp. TaxID=162155 RepID=UPI0025D5DE2B|nr:hypothetical protein [uncultured Treponema sp.]